MEAFDAVLGDRPNQIERGREDVEVGGADLLAIGEITEAGLRANLNIGFQYVSFWLGGRGAVGLDKLMEDLATSRSSSSSPRRQSRSRRTSHTGSGRLSMRRAA